VLDANPTSLAAIGRTLQQVVGRAFWDTEWFSETPEAPERVRAAVATAARGEVVRMLMRVRLPDGWRSFLFSLRPVFNAKKEVVGLVPEAQEAREPAEKLAA
jgi:PAS domain-containing protein